MTRAARLGVCAVAVVTAVFAAVYLVKAVSQLGRTATTNAALSYDDREIAGGNSVIVDQAAAYEARQLIPVNADYRFASGSALRKRTTLTDRFDGDWFRYFLMPRRPQPHAKWIVCYGCDASKLGGSPVVKWHDDYGISILHLG